MSRKNKPKPSAAAAPVAPLPVARPLPPSAAEVLKASKAKPLPRWHVFYAEGLRDTVPAVDADAAIRSVCGSAEYSSAWTAKPE